MLQFNVHHFWISKPKMLFLYFTTLLHTQLVCFPDIYPWRPVTQHITLVLNTQTVSAVSGCDSHRNTPWGRVERSDNTDQIFPRLSALVPWTALVAVEALATGSFVFADTVHGDGCYTTFREWCNGNAQWGWWIPNIQSPSTVTLHSLMLEMCVCGAGLGYKGPNLHPLNVAFHLKSIVGNTHPILSVSNMFFFRIPEKEHLSGRNNQKWRTTGGGDSRADCSVGRLIKKNKVCVQCRIVW